MIIMIAACFAENSIRGRCMPSTFMNHCLQSLYGTPTFSASCCMMQMIAYNRATVFNLSMTAIEYEACLDFGLTAAHVTPSGTGMTRTMLASATGPYICQVCSCPITSISTNGPKCDACAKHSSSCASS